MHRKDVNHHRHCETFAYKEFDNGQYDYSMLTFPVKIKDIHKFEKKNNISINVYGAEKKKKILLEHLYKKDNETEEEEEDGIIYPLKITTGNSRPSRKFANDRK